jgi:DNA-binding transcriptional MocR family regulator
MWMPRTPGQKWTYRSIADAVASAIRNGELGSGDRLPPQRHLARRLGVNLSTVTRAYREVRERGLVDGEVGRGTFVRFVPDPGHVPWPPREAAALIDLSSNFPAPTGSSKLLTNAFGALRSGDEGRTLLQYQSDGALPGHVAAGLTWLTAMGLRPRPETLFITNGAIHGVFACLLAMAGRGDAIAL